MARRTLTAAAILTALAAPAQAQPEYSFTLTTWVPENNQSFIDYVQVFVDNVHAMTDGRVEIQAFGAGVIAGPFEGWQAVQKGTADMAYMFPAFLSNQDPTNAIVAAMPAGMPVETLVHWLYVGGGEDLWQDFRRETMGLQAIIAGAGPTEIFLHSNVPIRTGADLEGVKVRTAGAWAEIITEFGASPTVMPPAEIFTSLERGVIDATEYASPAANILAGYHDVADYIIVPGVHATSFAYEMVMQAEKWDALPDDLKEKIEMAARLTTFDSMLRTDDKDIAAMQEFLAGDNEIIELDPAFIEEVRIATAAWAQETAAAQEEAGNPWFGRIYDSYTAYQDDWRAASIYRWTDE